MFLYRNEYFMGSLWYEMDAKSKAFLADACRWRGLWLAEGIVQHFIPHGSGRQAIPFSFEDKIGVEDRRHLTECLANIKRPHRSFGGPGGVRV